MSAKAHGGVLSGTNKQLHGIIEPVRPRPLTSDDYHDGLLGALAHCDDEVYRLIGREYDRQRTTLQLIAADCGVGLPQLPLELDQPEIERVGFAKGAGIGLPGAPGLRLAAKLAAPVFSRNHEGVADEENGHETENEQRGGHAAPARLMRHGYLISPTKPATASMRSMRITIVPCPWLFATTYWSSTETTTPGIDWPFT